MFTPLKIDTSNVDRCLRELSRYTGAPQEQVVDAEFAKVIEGAIRFTPAANVAKIRDNSEAAECTAQPAGMYDPQSRSGKRARQTAKLSKNGKVLYFLKHHYPDALWQQICASRKASLQAKLHARGLAKQSWQRIADALGLAVKAPGYVNRALPRTGRSIPQNASGTRYRSSGKYGISARNSYPLIDIPTVQGRSALQRAITGRVKYFQKNLEKGVFSDLKKIAAKYPGIVAR